MSEDQTYGEDVVNGNARFAKSVYKILSKIKGNIFFSPISVHAILSLAAQGSEGATKQALMENLKLPTLKATAENYKNVMEKLKNINDITFYLANKIYLKEAFNLKEEFEIAVTKYFYSEIQSINFSERTSAAQTINSWVEDKTNEKIRDIVTEGDLDDDTRLVLVNAIYFKGKWAKPFDASETTTEKFYLNENETTDVQMMHINGIYYFNEIEFLDAKILAVPYSNRDVNMIFIVPNKKNGLEELEKNLQGIDFHRLMEYQHSLQVRVSIPKFKVETTIELASPLTELGLGEIFSERADFSGMIEGNESLYISKIIQKAFIEVNEGGTEAAAATAIQIQFCSMTLYTDIFVADRPFIFYLQHSSYRETPSILFKGRMVDPNI